MNNTIEFVLKMRDMMSSNITKVSSTSQSAFNRMTQSANAMTDRNKVLGMSFNELQTKIKQVEDVIGKSTIPSQIAAARKELALLQRQAVNHPGNNGGLKGTSANGIGVGGVAIGSMLGGAALQAGSAIVGAVGSGISGMITQSMDKERAIAGMTTFLGKQGATDAYKNIRQDANETTFDTASLLEVNRSLISAGANAQDARRDTMNLANAVSAVGGSNDVLTRMAANMQQIKTVGKATAMDIRQFGIAGINIYELLARSTGKNINQVKEMEVTYDQLAKALEMGRAKGGIYENALGIASNTKQGKWDTFKDNILTGLSDIGDAFSPLIDKVLTVAKKITGAIGPALERAKPVIDMISNGLGRGVDFVMELATGTGKWSEWVGILKNNFNIIWPIVQNIAVKLWEFVARIAEFVRKSEMAKDYFRFIGWIMEKVGAIIGAVLNTILWAWDNIIEPMLTKIEAVYKWIKGNDTITVKGTKTLIVPKIPKENSPEGSPLSTGGGLMASNSESGKSIGETVAGAGPKVINIHVGKFFDNLQFTTMNTGESANEIEKIVMECLARVVYNGSKMV